MTGLPKRLLLAALAAALLTLTYANHFSNDFHFDDRHTIVDNSAVLSLGNLPDFFTDSSTFSTLPTHHVYRPLLTASLALDRRLAGDFRPFAFHLSTYLWFLVLLLSVYALARKVYGHAASGEDPHWPAFAVAVLFGFHPVCAETLNYIIQRADVYSALGVAGSLSLYAWFPRARRLGLYLIPMVAGALTKPPTLIFVPLLGLYVWMFEATPPSRWRRTLSAMAPAAAVAAALGVLLARMNGPAFASGGGPALEYRLTQLPVAWGYFTAFFLPVHLTADTDVRLVSGIADPRALGGAMFVAALLLAAWLAARRPGGKPIAFGIAWFFLALAPTSWMPLAEVANDHRMFLPFVGLAMAAVWAVRLAVGVRLAAPRVRAVVALAFAAVLMIEAAGTRARNEVWRSEETLWRDVTEKSPLNGRGWMNYGVALMEKGDAAAALASFEKARELTPTYSNVYINLGIVKSELGRHEEAEPHFLQALALAPEQAQAHAFYGRWLRQRGRHAEALVQLDAAATRVPTDLATRHLRIETLATLRDWGRLEQEVSDVLALVPDDEVALQNREVLEEVAQATKASEQALRAAPTPEGWVNLSLRYYQEGQYADCARAAREALVLRPAYPEAYNNLAAALNSLQEWDAAIAAAETAVRLDPGFELARNNLAFAKARKAGAN